VIDSAHQGDLKRRHRAAALRGAAQALLFLCLLISLAAVWLVPAGLLRISFGRAHPAQRARPVTSISPRPSLSPSPVTADAAAPAAFDTWDNPNAIPVGYTATHGKSQMVAEIVRAPQTWASLSAVVPYISWSLGPVKSRLYLDVYSLSDPRGPAPGRLIAERSVPVFDLPSGEYFPMTFDPPILLEPGRYYSLQFSVRDAATQVAVGLVDQGVQYPNSRLWVFGYLYGPNSGEPLSQRQQWILTRADLVFKLSFG